MSTEEELEVAQRPRRPKRHNQQLIDRVLWLLRVGFIVVIACGLFAFAWQQIDPANPLASTINDDARRITWGQFEGLLVSGLTQGAMYGLVALGYSMVYGVLGFINFAHGEVFMVGAMSGFIVSTKLDAAGVWEDSFLVALAATLLVSVVTSALVAVLAERVAYRPLRNAPRIIPLITSIGVSFFLQNAVLVLLGTTTKSYPPSPDWLSSKRSIFGVEIAGTNLVVLLSAAGAMALLWYLVNRTRTGRAMRAVAEDREIAALMGIDVNRTIRTTFAVGGAMAGVAALAWGLLFKTIIHTSGFLLGIKAFSAAVLGGIGNMGGAALGGLTLGGAESLAPLMVLEPLGVSGASQLKDAIAFAVLIFVLLVRPGGLLGERTAAEDRA